MHSFFTCEWALDCETGKIAHVGELIPWGQPGGTPRWAAYIDGFSVDDTEQSEFDLPESRDGVAIDVELMYELWTTDAGVVGLEQDGDVLRRVD